MHTQHFRLRALAAAAIAALASPVMSQTSTVAPAVAAPGESEQTITITGSRAQTQSSIAVKSQRRGILDAVSQDEIGRLPDANIVEAVRRVTGVSVVGGGDPTKNRDIYQRATIRGLDSRYNLVTLDGNPIASADQSFRGARLEMLPASSVGRLEVIKTLNAGHDPHALGGQLNLVSRSALDVRGDSLFAFNAVAGRNSSAGKLVSDDRRSYKLDATGALKFGPENQFGLILSAELQHLPSSASSRLPGDTFGAGFVYLNAAGGRTPFAADSPTGHIAPIRAQDYVFENLRERASLTARLDYRLNSGSQISLFAGRFDDSDTESRYESLLIPSGAPVNTTATSGRFLSGDLQPGLVYQPVERLTDVLTLDANVQPWTGIRVRATLSKSSAQYREYRNMIKYAAAVTPGRVSSQPRTDLAHDYVLEAGAPRVRLDQLTRYTDPASYVGLYWRDIWRDLDQDLTFARLEVDHNAGPRDLGLGMRAGVNLTRTLQSWDVRYVEQTPGTAAAQARVGSLARAVLPQRPLTQSFGGLPFLLVDRDAARAIQQAQAGDFVTTDQTANNFADDYALREQVHAAYAEVLYQTDRWQLQAGLRQDRTDVRVDAFSAPTATGSTAYEPVRSNGQYDFVLPSLLFAYDIDGDVRLKAGYGKTIGRPDYAQYAARTTFGVTPTGGLTINRGNPDLKPREAEGLDLSLEWYVGTSGLLSAAVFDKSISNEIFTGRQVGPATDFRGTTYTDVTIVQPLNAQAGKVRGVELQAVRSSLGKGWMSGFGLATNLTLLKGRFDQPTSAASQARGAGAVRRTTGLLRQPDHIFNATLFHATATTDVRVSVNRIGRALEAVDQDTAERDLYAQARTQVDLQASWEFLKGARAVMQVQNLTRAPFVVRQGANGNALLNNEFPVGRTVALGLSISFGK